MKAIVQDRYGSAEVLEARDIDKPEIGDNEVLVRVQAASIHVGDWILMTGCRRHAHGHRAAQAEEPVPGTDVAGTVEAVGNGRAGLRPGDEVFGWCAGAFAEYAQRTEDQFVSKPANLTFEQAAAVGVSATTALQLLRDDGNVRPGQKVLINGASGGVGTFAVQIAKAFGAEVTGVCSAKNVEHGPLHRRRPRHRLHPGGLHDRARERYDLILDNVGDHSMADTRRALAPTGMLISNGGGHAGGKLGRVIRAAVVSMFVRQQATLGQVTEPRRPARPQGARRGRQGHARDRRYLPAQQNRRGDRPCRSWARARDGGHRRAWGIG